MAKQDISLSVYALTPDLLALTERFSSGNTYIDKFISNGDFSLNTDIGKTYILLSKDRSEIIGFYNLGVGTVDQMEVRNGKVYKNKMGGSININYFALDQKYHKDLQQVLPGGVKIYLSDLLLYECLERIEDIVQNYVGATFITLNSTEEGFYLYERNGFEKLEEDMIYSMEQSDRKCYKMYKWISEEM